MKDVSELAPQRRRLLWVVAVVAGALAVAAPVEAWALAGSGGQHVVAETPSRSGSPLPTDTSASPPPSLPKGACASSQLRVEKVTPDVELAEQGAERRFAIVRIQNTGEACTFKVPKTLEVASDTGPDHAVDVRYGGYGDGVLFHIPAGRSYIAISETWALSNWPPLCSHPITQVKRVQIPLTAGTIKVHLQEPWKSVCASPSTTWMMEYHPVPGTNF